MRRVTYALSVVVVLLGTVLVTGGTFAAQGPGSDFGDHPQVGTWVLDPNPEDPTDAPVLAHFSADGGYFDDDQGVGVWAPTGDTTATVTLSYVNAEEDRIATIRSNQEVAPDGRSWTGTYTLEFVTISTGETSGQVGPLVSEATRMEVEAPGTPVASADELLGGAAGTPAATPAT
jgi:hypothetical protein